MSFNLDEYVDVSERIRQFAEKFPEGSLQSEIEFVSGGVLCKAFAYRTAADERPGIGHAFEPIPGKTPYTRDSETMNAETSAWGRAIVALGFETKKIASANEVRARQGSGAGPTDTTGRENPANPGDDAGSTPAPDNPAAKAQAAQEAAKAARTPTDDGNPANVLFTFGKHKGATVGQVPRPYLEWLTGGYFEAKTAEQRRLLAAAHAFLIPEDDDGVPFE